MSVLLDEYVPRKLKSSLTGTVEQLIERIVKKAGGANAVPKARHVKARHGSAG